MDNQVRKIRLSRINVIAEHRPLVPKQVQLIADSMDKIGLKTPITVRSNSDGNVLVTGQHRLEAARLLGWRDIDCFVIKGKETESRLWTLAENLHRADLTALERAEFVVEWESLIRQQNEGAQHAQPGGRQPEDKGISTTAKQLGMTRDEVRRSRAVATISPEAKRAAKAAGLADNQAALLEV